MLKSDILLKYHHQVARLYNSQQNSRAETIRTFESLKVKRIKTVMQFFTKIKFFYKIITKSFNKAKKKKTVRKESRNNY